MVLFRLLLCLLVLALVFFLFVCTLLGVLDCMFGLF